MKKTISILTLLSLSCFSTLSFAEATTKQPSAKENFLNHLSGNMALTNNYVFRGISQTREEPAVQGGLAYTFDSKIHLNIWGSNVNFESPTGQTATLETDETIGYGNTIKDFTYDISIVRYQYPRASTASYFEGLGTLSYRFLTFLIGYSSNVFGSHGPGTYTNLGVHFEIPAKYVYFEDITLSGSVGHYNLDKNAGTNYEDYNVQIAKALSDKYTISLAWIDTSHKNPPYDGSQWVFTVAAAF